MTIKKETNQTIVKVLK